MGELKYGEHVFREVIGKSVHPEITAPTVSFKCPRDSHGNELAVSWSYVAQPFVMEQKPATGNFDRFLVFAGGDPLNMDDFKAEVEIALGPEGEKHILNQPSVVFIPGGMRHYPLSFNKVEKPVMLLEITSTESAQKGDKAGDISYINAPAIKPTETVTRTYRNDKLIREQKRSYKELTYTGKDVNGGSLTLYWFPVTEPHIMYEPPHSHDHDMLALFLGGDPSNVGEFKAELDMWLGEEGEKHSITSTAIVHHPKGLVHRHVDFQRVDKPFMEIHIFMAPEYQKARTLKG